MKLTKDQAQKIIEANNELMRIQTENVWNLIEFDNVKTFLLIKSIGATQQASSYLNQAILKGMMNEDDTRTHDTEQQDHGAPETDQVDLRGGSSAPVQGEGPAETDQ